MRQVVRGKWKSGLLTAFLSVALAVTMIPVSAMPVSAAEDEQTGGSTETLSLAILSDIHYVSDENRAAAGSPAFEKAALTENRMMAEIDLILDQALRESLDPEEGIVEAKPDAALVCGDLCSNGELMNEEALAAKLGKAREDYKTDIYVVNGNHDINMSYGAKFTGGQAQNAERTQALKFREVYETELGYDPNKVRYYDPNVTTGKEVRNYGGLSYATEIKDGVTLIALDTAQYSADTSARFSNAQKTAGAVSDGLLAWAADQAKAARAKGNLVLAMCHHSLIQHQGIKNDASDLFFSEYLVPDWEKVAGTLADAGVSAVLTGHSHANDISQYTSEAGNTIYDIQTAALCAYPCAWRTINITIDKSGDQPSCSFDIDTHFMDEVEGLDLEFNGKNYEGLQHYSYVKTGLPEESLTYLGEFLIREQLYAIMNYEGGFNGYLQEQLQIPEGQDTGQYSQEAIAELIDSVEPIEENFNLLGSNYTLKLSRNSNESTATKKVFDVALIYGAPADLSNFTEVELEIDKIPEEIKNKLLQMEEDQKDLEEKCVEISRDSTKWIIKMPNGFPEATKVQLYKLYRELTGQGETATEETTEQGKLFIDVSGFAAGINKILSKADEYIKGEEGDWNTNYGRTEIEQEAAKLLKEQVVPLLTKPIDETDVNSSPNLIARDALQAFARGDEDSYVQKDIYGSKSAEDLKAMRKGWVEDIQSKAFDTSIKQTLLNTIGASADSYEYEQIAALLNVRLTAEDGKIFSYEVEEGTTLPLIGGMLEGIKTPREAIALLKMLDYMGVNPISGADLSGLSNMFVELQTSMTTDTNIQEDSEWSFHTVNLDPQGGNVSTTTVMTIDDHKAGALPTPEKYDNKFLGWFTDPEAGDQVTADSDLSEVNKVYAHWKAIDRATKKGEDGTAFGKGAAIEAAEAAMAKMSSDKDPSGTRIAPFFLKSSKQTKKSVKLTWKKASGATKYVVYGSLCGTKNKMKKLATTTGTSFNAKKLKKGKYYKYMVIAVDANNDVVSSSKIIHVATSGKKSASNPKKVVVKAKINKAGKKLKKYKATSTITLKSGSTPKALVKSTALKTSFTKAKKTKVKTHVGMRYESTNPAIATVSAKGKVTAKKKGSCKIYVYAQNGAVKTVTVKVK